MQFDQQLFGAFRALNLDASPRSTGGITFGCPACQDSRLEVANSQVSCPVCDWSAMGEAFEIAQAAKAALRLPVQASEAAPRVKTLAELQRARDNSDELLKDRFLCQGGGLLLVGPSGIGKSSFSMQCMILWAIGRECFGLRPAKPLKSLLIQAENDEGDLAEMRDGVIRGLKLSKEDAAKALANIRVHTCNTLSGEAFLSEVVAPLVAAEAPDLLWLDPALAYLGGDANSQEAVGGFLRNGLNPIIVGAKCAVVIVHHTNKPPSGKEKGQWSGNDLAYLGAGSAEWTNWSRAVVALRGVGSHEVFDLVLGKRGARAGWVGEQGEKIYSRPIAHCKEPGAICWEAATDEQVQEVAPRKNGRPKAYDPEELLMLLGEDQLTTKEMWSRAEAEGWKERTFKGAWVKLRMDGKIEESRAVRGEWRKAR